MVSLLAIQFRIVAAQLHGEPLLLRLGDPVEPMQGLAEHDAADLHGAPPYRSPKVLANLVAFPTGHDVHSKLLAGFQTIPVAAAHSSARRAIQPSPRPA